MPCGESTTSTAAAGRAASHPPPRPRPLHVFHQVHFHQGQLIETHPVTLDGTWPRALTQGLSTDPPSRPLDGCVCHRFLPLSSHLSWGAEATTPSVQHPPMTRVQGRSVMQLVLNPSGSGSV